MLIPLRVCDDGNYNGTVVHDEAQWPMNADLRMADEVQQWLLENENVNSVIPQVNIGDVVSCISRLKRHKAAGHDNITNEHLIYGDLLWQFISLYSLRLWFVTAMYLMISVLA